MLYAYNLYFKGGTGSTAATAKAIRTCSKTRATALKETSQTSSSGGAVTPERPIDSTCGTHRNPAYGNFRVVRAADGLRIVMGPRPIRAPLYPAGGNPMDYVLPDLPLRILSRAPGLPGLGRRHHNGHGRERRALRAFEIMATNESFLVVRVCN
jgi:hypothetical protein